MEIPRRTPIRPCIPTEAIFDLGNLFRGGDQLINLTGVVDYNYGEYKIQPTIGAIMSPANPRSELPSQIMLADGLKVASFNVLNYFTTLDDGTNDICGPAHDMECRGADTIEEFDRQRAKIIAALAAIDADVVGLIEIENNEFEAVADLVDGLNAVVGAGTYGYVDTGYIGLTRLKSLSSTKPRQLPWWVIMLSWIPQLIPRSSIPRTGPPWPKPSWMRPQVVCSRWWSITSSPRVLPAMMLVIPDLG